MIFDSFIKKQITIKCTHELLRKFRRLFRKDSNAPREKWIR